MLKHKLNTMRWGPSLIITLCYIIINLMRSYAMSPPESHLVTIIEKLQEETHELRNKIKNLEKRKDEMLEEQEDDFVAYKNYEASSVKKMEELQQVEYNTIEECGDSYIIPRRHGLINDDAFRFIFDWFCHKYPLRTNDLDNTRKLFNNLALKIALQNMGGEHERFDIEDSRLWELRDEWGDDLVDLLIDPLNELAEYIEDHPNRDFSSPYSFYVPWNKNTRNIVSYPIAIEFLANVLRVYDIEMDGCACTKTTTSN